MTPSPAHTSGAVFLSYASQDAAAARCLCEALRAAGIEVWFDQSELVGGDAWDAKIRKQIGMCALFVPILSANTQAREEGYFRLEWKLAAQRTHMMTEEKAFVLPVVIDGTRDADAKVPAEFRAVQWTRVPAGESSAAFCARIVQLLGEPVADPGSAVDQAFGQRGGLRRPAGRRVPTTVWVTTAIALAAIIMFLALRPTSREDSVAGMRPPTAAPAPTPLGPAEKSIAVLPFANLSDDKDSRIFADGVHQDILINLGVARELRVIPRTSVEQYRDTKKTAGQIGAELNVAYLLQGTVRRAGNTVRVTGQLVRAATSDQVKVWRFDRELRDIFAIQSAIATEIAIGSACHAVASGKETDASRADGEPGGL